MYNISIVVVKTINDVIDIGSNHVTHQEEVARFHKLTRFKTVVVGRRTHEKLGALPQRINLVLSSRNLGLEDVLEVKSIQDILEFSKTQEVFVLGGSEVFNQMLPYANKIYLTLINKELEGTMFLRINEEQWEIAQEKIVNEELVLRTLVRRENDIVL